MSDHLPECPRRVIPDRYAEKARAIGIYAGDCICSALRACEQRVADDIWGAIRDGSQYKSGFEGGLDAARDAVAGVGVRKDTSYDMRVQALAAIDALKEKP